MANYTRKAILDTFEEMLTEMSLFVWSKMVIPISFFRSFTDFVRLGCERSSAFAALLNVPASATVTMYFNCCNVIVFSILLF